MNAPFFAFDAFKTKERRIWQRAKSTEAGYAIKLRKIARHIDDIVKAFDLRDPASIPYIQSALMRYAKAIEPWAESVGASMVAEIAARDKRQWRRASEKMGRALHIEIESAPTGRILSQLMNEQVSLIKSLPIEAAQRVHEIATGNLYSGDRAGKLIEEIMKTGEVSRSRANMIAVTETGRASTNLTQARAEYVGSPGYKWRTQKDGKVRPSHRALEGKFVEWSAPPTTDGLVGHAGAVPNCRCFCEVVL